MRTITIAEHPGSMEPPLVKGRKKANPAADPRKMRRTIAEDPDWNLETVPPLVDACITHILKNFHERPLLDELLPKHKQKVLNKLSPSVPLIVTAPLISDESYWKRCCQTRWSLCDVSAYQHCWKTMYLQRNLEEAIETFVPGQSDIKQLEETLRLSSPFVSRLHIKQLLPPPRERLLAAEEAEEGDGEDAPLRPCNDHLDSGVILSNLKRLEELQLVYGVQNCGMNFEWGLFEFTKMDCQLLARAVKATPTLHMLRVHRSKVDNERGRLLISHLLDHPSLSLLDLAHNSLGEGAGRALGKLLNGHSPQLMVLDVSDNQIGSTGGVSIGHALQDNTTLTELNLRMNRLGDEGAQPILKALLKNTTLTTLNLGSNNIGEPSAPALSEMLIANKTLSSLNVTCNKFGEAGGKLIQEGMEENATLVTFDLRLTELNEENEYCINQIVKNNQDRLKKR